MKRRERERERERKRERENSLYKLTSVACTFLQQVNTDHQWNDASHPYVLTVPILHEGTPGHQYRLQRLEPVTLSFAVPRGFAMRFLP